MMMTMVGALKCTLHTLNNDDDNCNKIGAVQTLTNESGKKQPPVESIQPHCDGEDDDQRG